MSDNPEIDDLQKEILLLKLSVAHLGQLNFEQRKETQRLLQVLMDLRGEMRDVRAGYRRHFRRAKAKLDKMLNFVLKQEPTDDWWQDGGKPPWDRGGDDGGE